MSTLFIASSLFSQEFTINLNGQYAKENKVIKLDLLIDEENKLVADQKVDYLDSNSKIKSLKIITTSGLKGTMIDEREIVIFYKTSLNIQGLKIRNLYKVAHVRVYDENTNLEIKFDKDHYQNIISYLRYHNVGSETIKDLDNLYGSWNEVEVKNDSNEKAKSVETSEITELK